MMFTIADKCNIVFMTKTLKTHIFMPSSPLKNGAGGILHSGLSVC